jgi:hypothetical protein
MLIATNDPELLDWIVGARDQAGHFLSALAEAALHADWENYPLLRPMLLKMQEKFPKYRDEKKLTKFTNLSVKRDWSEEECRVMVNAALCKLIDDAGGRMAISVSDLFAIAPMGSLAMALSDDDKVLTLTRLRTDS